VTGRRYTYAEARELCRRFAASLRRAGLQPGNTLAIVMPNTAEWPIVLLGAVEAGLVVSGSNPNYTAGKYTLTLPERGDGSVFTRLSFWVILDFTLSPRRFLHCAQTVTSGLPTRCFQNNYA
jgi:long-chain acyl-CoA synthetase